jgi:hypothetical protein
MSVDQGLQVRATSISSREQCLSQPERKLLRLQPKGDLGRQEKTRKQQRVDVDARRLQPGLGEDVMEQVRPRAVGIVATETVLVDQTKAWEWRMRRGSMFNRHDLVGLDTCRYDPVQNILVREVERIGQAPLPVPGAVGPDLCLASLQSPEQIAAERIGDQELPGVEVWLLPKGSKAEYGTPVREEPILMGVVVHERNQSTTSRGLNEVRDGAGDDDVCVEEDHDVGGRPNWAVVARCLLRAPLQFLDTRTWAGGTPGL